MLRCAARRPQGLATKTTNGTSSVKAIEARADLRLSNTTVPHEAPAISANKVASRSSSRVRGPMASFSKVNAVSSGALFQTSSLHFSPTMGGRSSMPRVASQNRNYSTTTTDVPGNKIRNIAIIAHVDHGKTSLVDELLKQSDMKKETESMDSNALERERGITILAKSTAIFWKDMRFNIVDTPGHNDFGGEVERVLNMVDGVVLVVDAAEGPMPQTKFVLTKALRQGLRPIVVINKMDRPAARVEETENEIWDLFVDLEADDEQMKYPTLYASAREGWAIRNRDDERKGMTALYEAIRDYVNAPKIEHEAPVRMLVSMLEHDDFFGKIITGRITSGVIKPLQTLQVLKENGEKGDEGRVVKVFARRGFAKITLEEGVAGDIVGVAGFPNAHVTDTLCDPTITESIPAPPIDPPVVSMLFTVNDSPLGGKEGSKLTASMIKDRLIKESESNVSLRVVQSEKKDSFEVSGRGELQLAVLVENMRREGFELAVSPPVVIFKHDEDGKRLEPFEEVIFDINDDHIGMVMERMTLRKGECKDIKQMGGGRSRLTFHIPVRGLIGFRSEFTSETRGTGLMNSSFHSYQPHTGAVTTVRRGSIISMAAGTTTAHALEGIQSRGILFVHPATDVYAGMVIGESSKYDDIDVNPTKAKHLTNVRSVMKDDKTILTPPKVHTLEEAISYVQDDELIEVTPSKIRIRKKELDENKRRKEKRNREN